MGTDAQKAGFKAVSELVKSWRTGDYVHHVRHLADKGTAGHDFLVIFSLPQPTKPVPEQVAHATFTVRMPEAGDEEAAPKISYTVDDLKKIMQAANKAREEEAAKVQQMVKKI